MGWPEGVTPPPSAELSEIVKWKDEQEWRHFMRGQFADRDARETIFNKIRDERLAMQDLRLAALQSKLDSVEHAVAGIQNTVIGWDGAMKMIERTGKVLRPFTWFIALVTALIGLWIALRNLNWRP